MDARFALTGAAAPDFGTLWEEMARTAFRTHRDYLGLPGTPVEWVDQYSVTDSPARRRPGGGEGGGEGAGRDAAPPDFASYRRRIADLTPKWRKVPDGATPFGDASVARSEIMIFNIADYGHTLMNDFFIAGGRFERAEFRSPQQVAALGKRVVINCTGLGARALWKDETLVPVRGQIARLIPQPEVRYALTYRHVLTVPRRDGLVVQSFAEGEGQGYGDTSEAPDRAEAEEAVGTLAELFSGRTAA